MHHVKRRARLLWIFDVPSNNNIIQNMRKWPVPTATVIRTHMINFDLSAVVHPICRWMSAEVKTYTQHHCCACSVLRQSIFHSSFLLWWSFYSCPLPIRVVVQLCFLIDTLFRCINNPPFLAEIKRAQNMKRPSFRTKKTEWLVSMRISHQPEKEVGWDSILTFSKESAYLQVMYYY